MNSTESTYLLLFQGPHWDQGVSIEELQERLDKVTAWFDGLQAAGKIRGGNALGSERRLVSGKNRGSVTDGPFLESKEAVGGTLVIQADSLEAALAIAESSPMVNYGIQIEVRPILEDCPCVARAKQRLADALVSQN